MIMDQLMFLIDTNIISELKKGERVNGGVIDFFTRVSAVGERYYL